MLVGTWQWVSFLLGLVTLSIGMSTLAFGDFGGNEFTVVSTLSLGGWVSVTAPFAGARVDDVGIRYRGIFKRAVLPWSEIQSISVDYVGGNGLLEAEMPVVNKADGKELPILILAGYTSGQPRVNNRVRRQATAMQEALARAGSH
ncbi:PH domain-containing protein [Streptomyces sp. NPDC016459]|uniref:PH domain-containing protein n=1 Tax=Streptomyces sp. NPDC016459 TaxID=3157190 RepID=UPI0033E083F6